MALIRSFKVGNLHLPVDMAGQILQGGMPDFWQIILAENGAKTTCLCKAT
jgi:hypothetical protein